jgi:NitT/TauT family transport system permease protein
MQQGKQRKQVRLGPWTLRPKTVRSAFSAIVLLLAWQLAGTYLIVNKLFFATPSDIVMAAINLWHSGQLQLDIIASYSAIVYGMVIAIVVGIAIGVLSGTSDTFLDYTDWFFTAMYSTPLVAVAPILILWFGIGISSKVAVVFLMAVFPILISTTTGIRNTDAVYIDVARSFGATRADTIRKVMIPASVPFVVTGIRLAIGRAVVGVVVGELFGAYAGLGFLVFTAGQTFNAPELFLGVTLLAITGLSLTEAMKWIEARVSRTKGANESD